MTASDSQIRTYDYNTDTWTNYSNSCGSNGNSRTLAYDIESDRTILYEN